MIATGLPAAPFGRLLTAMVTPFGSDLSLDLEGAQRLAVHLADTGHDGVVVNGTTGESPTTTDHEQELVVRAVVEAVGDRLLVVAGASSNDTVHAVERARLAAKAGAHGLLVVTPYYNRPPQKGLEHHFTAVADATGLPVMLYDIPGRTGREIEPDTLVRLAAHERIVAVKDAKGDLGAASWVLRRSNLAWYSGEDLLNLPYLSIGAAGFVSVVGHVVGRRLMSLLDAHRDGRVDEAAALHQSLLPVYTGIFRTQGAITTKAALAQLGLPGGRVRPPLVDATEEELARLVLDLADGGVEGFAV
ncbi:MAG TPA: 4-hydroxy-tetrahydrodipicolinate synthase [Actinomycetes bacterium]|nr:4-hydroxy-tetrahydrodipicolinate synthase [Actinomycetes bacterium]